MKIFLFCLAMFAIPVWAEDKPVCPMPEEAIAKPLPVDVAALTKKIHSLKDENGKTLLANSKTLDDEIAYTFDLTKVKTKMEQFYRLLYIIAQELKRQNLQHVSFPEDTAKGVLLESKVFTDPTIPVHITSVKFDLTGDNPKCAVTFQKAGVDVGLNDDQGFFLFRNGKCQHAQKLIFAQEFSFEMKKNLGNLMISNLRGVNLFGDFGNRGIVDVDVQYVALRAVEFLHGSIDGKITAYVADEEFEKNQHNALLKLLSKVLPDVSVQPIEW